ncbi:MULTISPECIES: gp436 family protein [Pasteurellaceae]|uniref:gp436 family protein n=1 Tax=Pasteurellaceae TaxID=712 RepID=UPI00202246C1|nr:MULTISPECIES: phage protein Gp36 family protein [Pasteurellaceae]MCL7726155.1 DUF1320 family protein [Actinobacillus pleuropneumoniae]MCL7737339.1 DUF1320 family protein [Actinobacillus pleuropneumoniae]MDX3962152.1 DUF1320 family protein [Pasteurella multocida]
MLYATQDSLVKRYSANLIAALAGQEADKKVQEALEDASQTIDSYLAGRYSLPLNTVPAVLERHCCYLARYFLEKNRATEQARRDYEDSIKFLEKVATGTISLGLDENQQPLESNNSAIIESSGSVWGRKVSGGFI